MKKGIGTPQNREAAFRLYEFFGGRNFKGILDGLEGHYRKQFGRIGSGNRDKSMTSPSASPPTPRKLLTHA